MHCVYIVFPIAQFAVQNPAQLFPVFFQSKPNKPSAHKIRQLSLTCSLRPSKRFVNVAMIHCERYSPLQFGGVFFKCYLIVTFAELTVTKVVCLVLVHQKRLFKFITLLTDFGACFSSLVSMGSDSKICTGKTEDQCYMFKFF